MKKLLSAFAAALAVMLAFTGCPKEPENPEPATLESISVDTGSAKTTFVAGDVFSADGIVVKAKYSDGSKKTLESTEYTAALATANLDADGKVKLSDEHEGHRESADVTVTFEDKTKTYSVTITEEVKKITLDVSEAKKEYNVGDEFDATGIVVKAFYTEEAAEEGEDVSENATITPTGFDSSKTGSVTFKVKASYAGVDSEESEITAEVVDPDEETTDYDAPDLSAYYKKYFVTSADDVDKFGIKAAHWGCGSEIADNTDGTLTLTSSATGMWGGSDKGSVAAFTGFADGLISKYEWIVVTLDLADYELAGTGVNIKVCHPTNTGIGQLSIANNWKKNSDGTRTYFAPVSSETYADTKEVAKEIGLVVYGTGTIVVKEIYVAAETDPSTLAVTGITISPTTETLKQGGTLQFTVKDSGLNDVTSSVEYTLTGDAAEGSTITEAGLLTVGTTAGELTVTATYDVDGKTFTDKATVTVMDTIVNLITSQEVSTKFYQPGWDNSIPESERVLAVTEASGKYTISIPTACSDRWQAQFGITTDADISEGDDWYFSFKVKASAATGDAVIKFNNAATVLDKTFSVLAGEEKEVSFSGSADAGFSDIVVFFDFGFSAVNEIEISDIVIAKTN